MSPEQSANEVGTGAGTLEYPLESKRKRLVEKGDLALAFYDT
jgi:hypothetical protein